MLILNDTEVNEEWLRFNNIIYCLANLPIKIKGLVVKKNEMYYILINNKYSFKTQKGVVIHELIHIDLDHLYDSELAHKYPELENEINSIINKKLIKE